MTCPAVLHHGRIANGHGTMVGHMAARVARLQELAIDARPRWIR